jgi:hypothetical protein
VERCQQKPITSAPAPRSRVEKCLMNESAGLARVGWRRLVRKRV